MDGTTTATGLRLAVFSDTALPQINGVSRTLDHLAREVHARGGAVRLFTTTDPAAADDGDVVRFASRPFWAYPQLRLSLPSAARAARELRAWGANLVHATTPFGVGLAGRRAARALGLPFVSSYHTSLDALAHFYRLGALATPGSAYLRWFHNSGRRTYCPTRAVEAQLRALGFANTALWGRGVDTGRFAPRWRSAAARERLGAAPHQVVVAYVGRLAAEKGLDVALAAMRAASERAPGRFVFALAGDGPYAARCRALAPPGTVFTGPLLGDALSEFYASADLFVFPSTTDTFGNVMLEAMASGLPVVAASVGPSCEVLAAGGGTTVPAGDAAAMADALVALAADPARRAALAVEGRANVATRSWARICDGLVDDYARVRAEHAAARAVGRAAAPRPRSEPAALEAHALQRRSR